MLVVERPVWYDIGVDIAVRCAMANKHDEANWKYIVRNNDTGRKYKSASLKKAAKVSGLNEYDVSWASQSNGRADSDTHTVKPQSNGKPSNGFAFR